MKSALSLQLHSLRREMERDPDATLRLVPSLGFSGVELAGTHGWSACQWTERLNDLNLKVVGAHLGLVALETEWEALTAFQRTLGNNRLIVSSLPSKLRSEIGYHAAARRLNAQADRARAENFQLLYHNHAYEFAPLDSAVCGMEVLLKETDPKTVALEVDTYWVERGGRDSARFVEEHSSRVRMIHAKELRKRDEAEVPAGQGDVDFRRICSLARKNDWAIVVEYEGDDALRVVAESARYLRALL